MSKTPESTLCLCMMVKNEAHIIRRALESVKPHIDHWVICDTGSTDNTPELITNALQGINGELHRTEWRNFGHNREELLALAKGKCDYIVIMDADMTLNVHAPFKHKLHHDSYEIRYDGNLDYSQQMVVSNRHEWQFKGVTHEFIFSETASNWEFLPEVSLVHHADGGCRSEKYQRDIQLLTDGLEAEPDNARYMFYLAQSFMELKQWENALQWYERRIEAEGWEEETWYATFKRAEMMRMLDRPWPEVHAAYLLAFDMRPLRLEPIYAIARHYREQNEFFQAYLYSSMALQGLSYPVMDRLFVEKPVYDYLLLFEFVICAYAYGRISETIAASNLLLQQDELPKAVYDYVLQTRALAGKQLPGSGTSAKTIKQNKIVVVSPFHNAGAFLDECVRSLLSQDYERFEVIFIDDASTDANREFLPPEGLQATMIRRTSRQGAAFNLHHAIAEYCSADDIVVCLDGDDQLARDDALSFINAQYANHDCWVMYGQYLDAEGLVGISAPFASPKDFATLRHGWRTSHIKTFRAGLFHSIAAQDPDYRCMKDRDGEWLHSAVDAALIIPLLEMAGFYRVRFNDEILYLYSSNNPISHHFNDREAQRLNFDWVCSMRPFARIDDYHSAGILSGVL